MHEEMYDKLCLTELISSKWLFHWFRSRIPGAIFLSLYANVRTNIAIGITVAACTLWEDNSMHTATTTLSRSVSSSSRTYFNWQFLVFWIVYLAGIATIISISIAHVL